MSWYGKICGAILGLIIAGPLGAAIGAFIGHQFDRGLSVADLKSGAGVSHAERQRVFFETTFRVMGSLAKADGRVSEAEIQVARAVMHQMQLRPEAVRRAIDLFNEGKQPGTDIDGQVQGFRRACGSQPQLVRTFLEVQLEIVLAKGTVTAAERTLLWRVADLLGVGRVELAQLEAVLRAQRHFRREAPDRAQQGLAVGDAYKALGIQPDASDKEVKTAYRRLMNQHHPDKLVAKGMPESMLEVAKERTREIRAAYELIKERRGIK
ncbi:MAG: co-chaperone DjlA [Gammaproteobacteria bacterium]